MGEPPHEGARVKASNAAWERAAEVRRAARAWREAGAVGADVVAAVEERYPDPRVVPSFVFHWLMFVGVSAVILTGAAFLAALFRPGGAGFVPLALVVGAVCMAAAEALDASPRSTARGAVGAASFWGVVFLVLGVGFHLAEILHVKEEPGLDIVFGVAAILFGACAFRWGIPVEAGLGLASLFLLLSGGPWAWARWFAVGLLGAGLCHARLDRASLAPSSREAAAVCLAVNLAAAYASVNFLIMDTAALASLKTFRHVPSALPPGAGGLRILSAVVTGIFPLAILAWGLRTRRRLLIGMGAVFAALSFITLRYYVSLAPLWVVLTGAGLALAALGFFLERFLERGPARERGGYTAGPLFSGDAMPRGLDWVPAAAAFAPQAPAASPAAAPAEQGAPSGFTGQGGSFGGGGASGSF
jgi:hypothetical protein